MTDTKEMLTKGLTEAYDEGLKNGLEAVVQLIKELRPTIRSLETMGKPMTTEEWFDTLEKIIKEKT